MSNNMRRSMSEKSSKSDGVASMSAVAAPRDRAREMVLALGGPIRWGETKERIREKCAWKLNHLSSVVFSLRRVRAILSNEKIRLEADEYFAIERAWERANQAVASLSRLARDADLSAHPTGVGADRGRSGEG